MSEHSTFHLARSTSHARLLGGGHGTVCPALPLEVRCSILRALLLAIFLYSGAGFTAGLFADESSTALTLAGARPAPQLRAFTETNLLALLTATLQRDYVKDTGELELTLTQPWTPPPLPDQPLSLKILELPTAGVTPAFIVRFELCTPDKTLGTWQTSLSARVWREVWVAHTNLRRDAVIGDADVVRERRNVLGIHEALANFAAGDATLELAEPVPAGAPLLARMVKPKAVVHRGQMTNALVQDGALSITIRVQALEDGAPGQIIHACNLVSQRNLSGRVLDDKTILISL